MGTETFTAFDSSGSAWKLKGRILRHLSNDPVTEADKSNIRSTLGITSQGGLGDLLAANNLDDVASTSTAMENLKIPSIGLQPNQVPLSGMLNSGAWVDWDSHYETGTWTPSVTFGGNSVDLAASIYSGVYTKLGNICIFSCNLTLTDKGTSNGTAVITGLPFTAGGISTMNGSVRAVYAANMSGLTGGIEGRTTENSTSITLQDWGATGVAVLTEANFNDNSAIRLAGTYQIA